MVGVLGRNVRSSFRILASDLKMAAVVATSQDTDGASVPEDTTVALPADEESSSTNYRGYLEKEGHIVNTGYKKRFFILMKTDYKWSMSYYVDLGQGRLGEKKGEIDLRGTVSKGELETDFIVALKEKTFKLRAADAAEVDLWMERVSRAVVENEEATLSAVVAAGASFRGVLEKQGHFMNTAYKKRMFVLAQQVNGAWILSYYVDAGQGRLGGMKGEIVLKGAIIENGDAPNKFTLIAKDKTFQLRASDENNATEWKAKIQEAIDATPAE